LWSFINGGAALMFRRLPDVDDSQGSAIDANILARYILLSSQRYPEGEPTVTPGQIAQLFTTISTRLSHE